MLKLLDITPHLQSLTSSSQELLEGFGAGLRQGVGASVEDMILGLVELAREVAALVRQLVAVDVGAAAERLQALVEVRGDAPRRRRREETADAADDGGDWYERGRRLGFGLGYRLGDRALIAASTRLVQATPWGRRLHKASRRALHLGAQAAGMWARLSAPRAGG